MDLNGVDLSGLEHGLVSDYPDLVPGRTLGLDMDFLSYQVSAPADKDRFMTTDDIKGILEHQVEDFRQSAGAEFVELHVTPTGSNKGGRPEQAVLKEYQTGRKGKDKPRLLDWTREYIVDVMEGIANLNQEADDGMSIGAWAAHEAGTPELYVICSRDKDLLMCPGLHMDWTTREIWSTDQFGKIDQPKGTGTKFFWLQMLMGDTADDIPGLPKTYSVLTKKGQKPKLCGGVMAAQLLQDCINDAECFEVVTNEYRQYFEKHPALHWKTEKTITWGQVFASHAQLLWMRRYQDSPNDALNFMREVCV